MAKTNRKHPHSEEPPRRSNRTAGKSSASVNLPAHKAAAHSTTSLRKDTAVRKDTAASPSGDSDKFSGECKGPPEAIVPAPEDTMPTMVAHDFAADQDFAAVPRASRRYPGSNNNGKYCEIGGEEDMHGGEDYDMAGEEGKHGGKDYGDEDYESVESVDDRDGDFVPKLFSSDYDDFDHLLNDDDINEVVRRIENMDSKSRIPTGCSRGNLIMEGPVAPNYKLMSASKASEARIEYQSSRKNYRDGIRRERLRVNKGLSFDEVDYTGDLMPTLRPMALVLLARLQVGQTFPESSLVKLRVAEEANHRGIYFSVHKSNELRLICKGEGSFFVQASNSDIGWSITKCKVLVQQGDQPVWEITTSK